ncbi:KR domain-containing protein [Streptomyces sp. DHE17-7]|uniref:KR domain-containing protein n=1 Tax=Streptomyces sp. DHE17-7 TaxID=2759949 RepID=UPI003FA6A4CF
MLVTGGTGGLGSLVARHLVAEPRLATCVVSRGRMAAKGPRMWWRSCPRPAPRSVSRRATSATATHWPN